MTSRRAVFLDRDGTLNVDIGYPRDPDRITLLPGAAEGLRAFTEAGFALVVVSNQSGIGRGLVTPSEAAAVHERICGLLAEAGTKIDDYRYCPHAPEDRCDCRKPRPSMLHDGARKLGIDLKRSWMVGDKPSDVEAGRRAGCRTVLIGGADAAREAGADHSASAWPEVIERVLGEAR